MKTNERISWLKWKIEDIEVRIKAFKNRGWSVSKEKRLLAKFTRELKSIENYMECDNFCKTIIENNPELVEA